MHTVIRSGEIQPNEWGTIKFEGEPYGSGASFFLVNNQPGEGPGLHKHPYPETWIVRSGHARFRAGDQELKASTGDIVVVSAETPHEFKNIRSASTSSASIRRRGSSKRTWNRGPSRSRIRLD